MQKTNSIRSLQRDLKELDVIEELYLDADNNRLSVRFRSGYDFRLEQVLRDYQGIDITAQKDEENTTKAYIGEVEESTEENTEETVDGTADETTEENLEENKQTN